MNNFVQIYKMAVRSITVPLLTRLLAFLDGKRWVPIFFLLLTRVNTNDMLVLQVLHNIGDKTGRKVLVITAWPFWPLDTGKDKFTRSLVIQMSPWLYFVWLPTWIHKLIKRYALFVMRIFQVQEILNNPRDMQASLRFSDASTIFQTDILTHQRRSVLKIPASHEEEFKKRLRDLGVGPDDWFVCVHAREDGFTWPVRPYGLKHADDYSPDEDNYRNVDIETYFSAIEYINSRGGTVIRMGDPSMRPIQGFDRLIDYPFTEQKSLPMDFYLVSQCRFVLGCDAGFSTSFPVAFGKPLLVTNLSSTVLSAVWPYYDTRLLLTSVEELVSGRILDLRERSHPRISTVYNAITFKEMGYRWLPNTSEEILEATKEMLEMVEKNSFDSPLTAEQEYFDQCLKESLDIMRPTEGPHADVMWSAMKNYQSRVSASFASRNYREESLKYLMQEKLLES